MFIRLFALLVYLTAIIACSFVVYDVPGWSYLQLDMKIIIGSIGSLSFLILTFLVLVPEEKLRVLQMQRT